MLEGMFPRVKFERKTAPTKFVAANGEQIRDVGEQAIPFNGSEGIQRGITLRSACPGTSDLSHSSLQVSLFFCTHVQILQCLAPQAS